MKIIKYTIILVRIILKENLNIFLIIKISLQNYYGKRTINNIY
jgi:hypothetical protein